jgi:hypothetical protein
MGSGLVAVRAVVIVRPPVVGADLAGLAVEGVEVAAASVAFGPATVLWPLLHPTTPIEATMASAAAVTVVLTVRP